MTDPFRSIGCSSLVGHVIFLARAALCRFTMAFLGVSAVLLTSCTGSGFATNSGDDTAGRAAYQLSPALTQGERLIMTAALAALEPDDRNSAVILYYNNAFHVNQPQYANGPFVYRPTGIANQYSRPDGSTIRFVPSFDLSKSNGVFNSQTGVARAVYSPGGYSWFSSNVYLDCVNTLEESPQTAEVYTGGNSPNGKAADIGLEFNPRLTGKLDSVKNIEPLRKPKEALRLIRSGTLMLRYRVIRPSR